MTPAPLPSASRLQPPFTIEPPAGWSDTDPTEQPPSRPTNGKRGLPPGNALGEWEKVIGALEDAGRFGLYGYRHAKVLTWDARELTLGFTPEFHHLWAGPEQIKELQTFLHERYGQKVGVTVRELGDRNQTSSQAARSVEDVALERAADLDRRKREEVLGNPAYIMLKERFNPVKVEINTDV